MDKVEKAFNLIKDKWTSKDVEEFHKYIMNFSHGEDKASWERRIVNTSLPCIAVHSEDVRKIVSGISKGNFMSFLDLWVWDNFTDTKINAGLIGRIKDIDKQKEYILTYADKADNWGTVDAVRISPNEDNENDYIEFAKTLLQSPHTFTRRMGIIIMLKCINERTLYNIFSTINTLADEQEYYVNMALAWLITECFIKYRDLTLVFLKTHKLNPFVSNTLVRKCRDSHRVSDKDKEMIVNFKQN